MNKSWPLCTWLLAAHAHHATVAAVCQLATHAALLHCCILLAPRFSMSVIKFPKYARTLTFSVGNPVSDTMGTMAKYVLAVACVAHICLAAWHVGELPYSTDRAVPRLAPPGSDW